MPPTWNVGKQALANLQTLPLAAASQSPTACLSPRISVPSTFGWWGDLVTTLLVAWLLVGLFIDGWAHLHVPQLESFFTPWHAVFYSGFLATALWLLMPVLRRRARGATWTAAIPRGYGLGLLGIAIFFVGGLCDFGWHTAFGFEKDLGAEVAPTHMVLFAGAMLIATSPLRAAQAVSGERPAPSLLAFLPVLLSATLAASLTWFFLMYAWPFLGPVPLDLTLKYIPGYSFPETRKALDFLAQSAELNIVVLSNLVLLAPALLLLRRWTVPPGSMTVLFGTITALMAILQVFARWESLIIALGAGLVADILARALRLAPTKTGRFRLFAGLVPPVFWSLYLIVEHLRWGLAWPPEMWAGIIVWTGFGGLALGILMTQADPATPSPSAA